MSFANLAEDGIKKHLHLLQGQADKTLEAGFMQALAAIETVLQVQYQYEIGGALKSVPIFRLGRGTFNDAPDPAPNDLLRQIVITLLADLEASRATLSQSSGSDQTFRLELDDLWFDIDKDGQRSETESAVNILAPVLLNRRQRIEFDEDPGILAGKHVDFDMSDQAWLLAYTHVLSGMGEIFLAFDPTEIISGLEKKEEQVFESLLAMPEDKRAALEKELEELTEQISEETAKLRSLSDLQSEIGQKFHDLPENATDEMRRPLEIEREESRQQVRSTLLIRDTLEERQSEIAQLLAFGTAEATSSMDRLRRPDEVSLKPGADFIYVLTEALSQSPDPDRIDKAHQHWLATIEHNKRFWASVAAETDDAAEWIPNRTQTGAIIQEVPDELREAWIAILSDAEKVLNGDLLIPHFLLPSTHGISLALYVESPSSLDPIPWLHGAGAYDYVKEGQRISIANWHNFSRLVGGNAAGFALFFN